MSAPAWFKTASEFCEWLQVHHDGAAEIWLKLRRTRADVSGITYAEALDQALCFGWIDGVRRPGDEHFFSTRFTPRKPRSIWSRVNVRHYERLERAGLVAEAGRAAFARRDPARTGLYSFESRPRVWPSAERQLFEADAEAWAFFQSQPPSYRRTATFWVLSAKRDETRRRRLAQLIEDSARQRRLKMLTRPSRTASTSSRA